MDDDEVTDLLLEIESTVAIGRRSEHFESVATGMPSGEHGRASLLLAAAEHRQMREEYAEARRLLTLVEDDGGETRGGVGAARLSIALDEGDEAGVRELADALRAEARRDALAITDYVHVAESFETHDRLREALRWFTMPLTYADPDDDDLDSFCLAGRYRVRRALELPGDRFDAVATRIFGDASED